MVMEKRTPISRQTATAAASARTVSWPLAPSAIRRKWAAPQRCWRGPGEPGHQTSPVPAAMASSWVIAPLAGVAVVSRSFLTVHRSRRWSNPGRWSKAHRRVRPQRPMRVPATGGSPGRVGGRGPSESCAGTSRGGWRLDHAAENTGRPTGIAAQSRRPARSDQRQQLVPRVGPPRRAAIL